MEISLIEKAAQIAVKAHNEQTRKSDGTPYVIHPFMVARKLMKYNFPETVIAAGLVHDVVEDSDFTSEDIRRELGEEVLEIIKHVSEDKSQVWEERKLNYANAIKNASVGTKAVCVADKIHNLESLLLAYSVQGEGLWSKFNRGRDKKLWFEQLVLAALKENWDHPLVKEYEELLKQMEKLK